MGQPGGKLDGRQPAFCTDLMELHRDGGDASQVPVSRMVKTQAETWWLKSPSSTRWSKLQTICHSLGFEISNFDSCVAPLTNVLSFAMGLLIVGKSNVIQTLCVTNISKITVNKATKRI